MAIALLRHRFGVKIEFQKKKHKLLETFKQEEMRNFEVSRIRSEVLWKNQVAWIFF